MRFVTSILICLPVVLYAQIGGTSSYQTLNVANNPRSAALGGHTISLSDGDIAQFFDNPATLDSVKSGNFFFQLNPYFADANFYAFAYAFRIKEVEHFAVGLHYLNFGSFALTDDAGQDLGSFSASDYVVYLSKSHRVGPFTMGASINFLNSTIDTYSFSAIAAELGGIFSITKSWSVALVFDNMGIQLARPSTLSTMRVPFDVRVGTTFKPRYMPLRFTLTSTGIANNTFTQLDETDGRSANLLDKMLRRVNFGAELLLSSHFQVLVGYSHRRKQELRLDEVGGGAGFSYGLMLKLARFEFRYSRATYHAAGGTSFLSLQTNVNDFKKIL